MILLPIFSFILSQRKFSLIKMLDCQGFCTSVWPVNVSLIISTKCLPCLIRLWLNSLNPFSMENQRPQDDVLYNPLFSILTWSGCNFGFSSFKSMVNQIENYEHFCFIMIVMLYIIQVSIVNVTLRV